MSKIVSNSFSYTQLRLFSSEPSRRSRHRHCLQDRHFHTLVSRSFLDFISLIHNLNSHRLLSAVFALSSTNLVPTLVAVGAELYAAPASFWCILPTTLPGDPYNSSCDRPTEASRPISTRVTVLRLNCNLRCVSSCRHSFRAYGIDLPISERATSPYEEAI